MSIAPAFLRLNGVSEDERLLIERGLSQIGRYRIANEEALSFFEGSFAALQFGISIPPSMQGVLTPVGWGGTVVETLEERLDWQGWHSEEDDFDLDEVYDDNSLDVESGLAHIDSLVFGTTFVAVGTGMEDEPNPLVTAHSPLSMTGTWDRRTRRLLDALAVDGIGEGKTITSYRLGETTTYELRNGMWRVLDRDQHRLPRIPVVMMPNRIRGSRETGRSEITKPIRYYCEAAARTLLGMEVSREFYNAPKIAALNVDESMFQDETGAPVSQWTAIMGRTWMVPPSDNPDDPDPEIVHIPAASPTPYLEQVKGYATYVAAEAGIPVSQFGFATDQPPSADAIRAQENRLVKRAERRQTAFGRAWLEVGRLALLIRDGEVPEGYSSVTPKWRDASTPTRAAAADEATKLIGSQVLPPDSTVTYDRVGLSPAEQRQVAADKRRAAGRAVLATLTSPQSGPDDADGQ